MVRHYKKKPIIVDAIQWTGENTAEIITWSNGACRIFNGNGSLLIETTEGQVYGSLGDYIIRGVKGEFYPCKPDIFEQSYDEVV